MYSGAPDLNGLWRPLFSFIHRQNMPPIFSFCGIYRRSNGKTSGFDLLCSPVLDRKSKIRRAFSINPSRPARISPRSGILIPRAEAPISTACTAAHPEYIIAVSSGLFQSSFSGKRRSRTRPLRLCPAAFAEIQDPALPSGKDPEVFTPPGPAPSRPGSPPFSAGPP